MNIAALVMYLVFGVVAFGWRTWLQWRRTGDTGLRMQAQTGSLQWWAKLGFVAALATGVAAPGAGLLGLDPIRTLDAAPVQVAGVALGVVGIVATAVAQLQMGASWRIGVDPAERTSLVTHGVFGSVRNPIFTAMLITAIGLALMVGNVFALAGLVALLVALEAQVRFVEEPYLRSAHGQDYSAYASTAGRFLPGVGRLSVTRTERHDAP